MMKTPKLLISILDRDLKMYYILEDPHEVTELVDGFHPVDELNRRYELAVDGHVIPWPHREPQLIEQYIHEFIHDLRERTRVPD